MKYKCKTCGYSGKKLIFQFTDYTYCLATNSEEPDYISKAPKWVGSGDEARIGEPVGCPKCKEWGVNNFEQIE